MTSLNQLALAGYAETDSAWRSFVFRFGLLVLLALVAIGTLNYLVNPEGLYQTHLVPQILWSARPQKTALLKAARPVPQAVILGSSRVMNIPPKDVERLTGLVTFNAGVDSAKTEDFYVLLRYAVENLHLTPRLVIIGIDVEAFHNHEPPHYYLQKPSALAAFLRNGTGQYWRWKSFTNLLSYQETQVSALALYRRARGFTENQTETDSDGYEHFKDFAHRRASGELLLNSEMQSTIQRFSPRYDDYTALSRERLAYMEDTLRYAHEHGIKVVVFTTPIHPEVEDGLRSHGYMERKREVEQALQQICSVAEVPFYDLSSTVSFGGDPSHFYDGVHFDDTFPPLMLSRMFPVNAHAVQ